MVTQGIFIGMAFSGIFFNMISEKCP